MEQLDKNVLLTKPKIIKGITFKSFQRGILLDNGYALNDSASFIFKECNGRKSVSSIIKKYNDKYLIDKTTATADVIEIINQLFSLNLISKSL